MDNGLEAIQQGDSSEFPNNDSGDGGVGPWPSAGDTDETWTQQREREIQEAFPGWDVGFFPYEYGQKETGSHWGGQHHACGETVEQSGPVKLKNAMRAHGRRCVAGLERTA